MRSLNALHKNRRVNTYGGGEGREKSIKCRNDSGGLVRKYEHRRDKFRVPEREKPKPVPVFISIASSGVGVGVIGTAAGRRQTQIWRGGGNVTKRKSKMRKGE